MSNSLPRTVSSIDPAHLHAIRQSIINRQIESTYDGARKLHRGIQDIRKNSSEFFIKPLGQGVSLAAPSESNPAAESGATATLDQRFEGQFLLDATRISKALDGFVGHARTSAEICAHFVGSDLALKQIEAKIAEINALFKNDVQSLSQKASSPFAFMEQAQGLTDSVQAQIADLAQQYESLAARQLQQDAQDAQEEDDSDEGANIEASSEGGLAGQMFAPPRERPRA
jgi:hypothetical protein